MPAATQPPDLNIPSSKQTVTVSIMDSTGFVNVPVHRFMEPVVGGHDRLTSCCYTFLIKHNNPDVPSKYDSLIFDLGLRKDFENSPKFIVDMTSKMAKITVEKNVYDILAEHGEEPDKVGGIIWSHYHWDHTGDPQTFPGSTDLIVGPGFKKAFVPAYPTVEDSPVHESAWEGRTLREIDFDAEGKGLKIGKFNAFDLYGDGSFYLLDTPGHAIGHICGLARTSADPPEFIFMGGDIAHHGSEFRPTQYLPLPENIDPSPLVAPYTKHAPVCPAAIFEALHPQRSSTEPFCRPNLNGVHKDGQETRDSIDKLKEFDAHDNILVNIAHDMNLYHVIELFPKIANGWSQKGWKEQGRWRFLRDFDTGLEEYKPSEEYKPF